MGPLWDAVVGALVGALGMGGVTWIIQKREWQHASEIRKEERRVSVMPYITFTVGDAPTSMYITQGKTTSMRFPNVTVRNDGLGPAKFTPDDVMDFVKEAVQGLPVPQRRLTLQGIPIHLTAGEHKEIDLVVRDLDGLDVPGGTTCEFEFYDMCGNRYSSEVHVRATMNHRGITEWLISTESPQIKAATVARGLRQRRIAQILKT